MKVEPIVSSETSSIRTQTPGNYPKRNKLHLEHGESLKTSTNKLLLLHLIGYLYYCISDARSHKHQAWAILTIHNNYNMKLSFIVRIATSTVKYGNLLYNIM